MESASSHHWTEQGFEAFAAPAKLNLFLHITGRRDDGYHLLQSVFRLIDLQDTVYLKTNHDVHSVVELAEKFFPGKGVALSQMWRAKQIEYMYLRTLMGRYVPHDQNTEAALKYCMKFLQLPGGEKERKALMSEYETLKPFPDAVAALPIS